MRPEERVDALTWQWDRGDRLRTWRSIYNPALGTNVPKLNLFEQWRASGSTMTFGEWARKQGGAK